MGIELGPFLKKIREPWGLWVVWSNQDSLTLTVVKMIYYLQKQLGKSNGVGNVTSLAHPSAKISRTFSLIIESWHSLGSNYGRG